MSNPAMSTQVQELPNTPPPADKKPEDDPLVNDVINEMEREFINQAMPPRQFNTPPAHSYPTLTTANTPIPPQYKSKDFKDLIMNIDKNHLQIAILAAFLAFATYYPVDTEFLYQKFDILQKLAPFDRIIRTILLAAMLYLLLWKFA